MKPSDPLTTGYFLALIAATATILGAVLISLPRKLSERFVAVTLLLVAGAMITVSITQILPASLREGSNQALIIGCFVAGIAAVFLLASINIGEPSLRSMWLISIALTLHNFPEGMTTIGATLIDAKTGITTATIVALHNIPEGIAIATLARVAGLRNILAFGLVLLATLSEISGASLIYFIGQAISENSAAMILAVVAGIMVTISLKELVPYSVRVLAKPNRDTK